MRCKKFSFSLLLVLFIVEFISRTSAQPASVGVPKFEVQAYRFEGETILPVKQLAEVLSPYTGSVDQPRLKAGLNRLQEFYWLNDITNISVSVPHQAITNGIVRVQIASKISPTNNSTTKAPVSFNVRAYRIEGNTVLPPGSFGVLSNYTGTNLTFGRLREGLGKVQLEYREYGFPTISVTLPPQRLSNGLVHVKVVEGRLADIRVSGNRWFSTANVRRALPSVATNILLNNKWFQPELDLANANNDRQIYPVISPGPDPGTTLLELKVKDQFPLHGHFEINDKSAPSSPLLRADTSFQYDNLWQLEHQVGVDYNFSPQSFKGDTGMEVPLDAPLVASYSGFYRMPFGAGEGLRKDSEDKPVTFGYDEITHHFNLPPPSGHPDLTFYASRSASDTALQLGHRGLIFSNTLAEISSQSANHTPTINNNLGLRLNVPVEQFWGIQSVFSAGLDFKTYAADTYSTNLTFFNLYAVDSFGNRQLVTNQTIRIPTNSSQSLYYLPLSYGWVASRPDKTGGFSFNWSQSVFLTPLASPRSDFQTAAMNTKAGGNYTTINAGIIRQQNLGHDWSLSVNLNGQWASEPLINNEQFALGGTAGVRGFQEGEVYGDDGWRTLGDLYAPPINVGYFPTASGEVSAILRCSVFMDYGYVHQLDLPKNEVNFLTEWGTGCSFLLSAGEHFDARLTLAWALNGAAAGPGATANRVSVRTPAGSAQAYFSIGTQF